jgi:hypothetical protein
MLTCTVVTTHADRQGCVSNHFVTISPLFFILVLILLFELLFDCKLSGVWCKLFGSHKDETIRYGNCLWNDIFYTSNLAYCLFRILITITQLDIHRYQSEICIFSWQLGFYFSVEIVQNSLVCVFWEGSARRSLYPIPCQMSNLLCLRLLYLP